MTHQVYSATGCTRCKILKSFLTRQDIPFEEYDMLADGKEAFQEFYKNNRKHITRGKDGVIFPIFTDGEAIRQGVADTIGYAIGGYALDGYFSVGCLGKDWVDGIHVSGGDPGSAGLFLDVLRYLKENNLKLQIDADGRNAQVLEKIVGENLADKIIVNVAGTPERCAEVMGCPPGACDIEKTVALAVRVPDYRFRTIVTPVIPNGAARYPEPAEVAEAARLIEENTGSKKNPYVIRPFNTESAADERLRALEPLTKTELFKYRSAARKHQVAAEIETDE